MCYNFKYGILFKYSPYMQCAIGRFNGYMLVMDVYSDTIVISDDDIKNKKIKINFTYDSPSKWNKLVKFITQ